MENKEIRECKKNRMCILGILEKILIMRKIRNKNIGKIGNIKNIMEFKKNMESREYGENRRKKREIRKPNNRKYN